MRASGLYLHITEKIITPGQYFRIAEEISTKIKFRRANEKRHSGLRLKGFDLGKNQARNKYSQALFVKIYHFVQAEFL